MSTIIAHDIQSTQCCKKYTNEHALWGVVLNISWSDGSGGDGNISFFLTIVSENSFVVTQEWVAFAVIVVP